MDKAAFGSSKLLQTPLGRSYGCYEGGEDRLQRQHTLAPLDGYFALVKANLGPGVLALPFVFGRAGWVCGFPILVLVVMQGVYAITLLVECKRALARPGMDNIGDVAEVSLGRTARFASDFFIFTVQNGCCCCYLNVVAGDLVQNLGILNRWKMTLALVPFFAVLVLARFASQLWLFNRLGVLAMVLAVVTSTFCGVQQLMEEAEGWHTIHTGAMPLRPFADSIMLCSSIFFAFEGLSVILPIEKEMGPAGVQPVIYLATSTLALAFMGAGSTCGVAFRGELHSGSIVAFLASRAGSSSFMLGASWLVTLAIFLTYPLQVLPAAQILAKYVGHPGTTDDEDAARTAPPWVWQRLALLASHVVVAVAVDNVALLVSLVGAVGQTGLGLMAPLCHFSLMRSGTLPKSFGLALLDVLLVCFCAVAMIFGTYFATSDILAHWLEQ